MKNKIASVVIATLAAPAMAAPIYQDDFESLDTGTYVSATNASTTGSMGSDWTAFANSSSNSRTASVTVQDSGGNNFVFLDAAFSYENAGIRTNEDVVGVASAMDYTLSLDARLRAGDTSKSFILRLEALHGGSWTTVASLTQQPTSTFETYSVTATAATMNDYVGDKLRIYITSTGGTNNNEIDIDNVVLVPEPSILALAAGIPLVLLRRRRLA